MKPSDTPTDRHPSEVAVVGSTTIERIVGMPLTAAPRVGGVTTYAGLTYRHLGLTPHIVSNWASGDSAIGEFLGAAGMVLHIGTGCDTTRFVNQVEGDRRFQEMPSSAAAIAAEQIEAILLRLDWVHLGPLHPLDIDPGVLSMLSDWDRPVLLDVQGYTRKRDPDTAQIRADVSDDLPGALTAARMVKANQEEMALILADGHTEMVGLMERFGIEEVVVTRGAAGGTVWSLNAPPVEYRSRAVRRWTNPTGAGDVFFAAYAVNRLLKGDTVQSAAGEAAALAAEQVSGGFIDTAVADLLDSAGEPCRDDD
jgi:sugar/nucleoside kinase (ribokinase family)